MTSKEETTKVDTEEAPQNYRISVKLKVSGTNNKVFGEFSFKGNDGEEAKENGDRAFELFKEKRKELLLEVA